MLNILSRYAYEADFYIFQSLHSEGVNEGSAPIGAFDDAIEAAIEFDIDILNVSAGRPWAGPVEDDPYSIVADKALWEGITLVCAAGNKAEISDTQPVNCPAAYSDAIAVGGMYTECPKNPTEHKYSDDDMISGPYSGPNSSFVGCCYDGCLDGESCIRNQTEKPWPANPDPLKDKPDVLAPVIYPSLNADDGIEFFSGTSYAAPLVSGTLGIVYGELKEQDIELPIPAQIRRALVEQSIPIDEGNINKPNITRLIKTLVES